MKTALALLPLLCSAPLWATTFVYVSNAESGTVSRYQLSEANGSRRGHTPAGKKIMPLAASPDGVPSTARCGAPPYLIISWRVSGQHGDLKPLAVTPVAASFPWITTDKSGR